MYFDDDVIDLITYVDDQNKKRVKPPFKNQIIKTGMVLNTNNSCIFYLDSPIENLNVSVSFFDGNNYNYQVDSQLKQVIVYDAPDNTLVEIKIVNPNPLPNSPNDFYWDNLTEDQKRAIMSTWTDIICVKELDATANEWGFDDRNIPKIFGWVNNYKNTKQPIPNVEVREL